MKLLRVVSYPGEPTELGVVLCDPSLHKRHRYQVLWFDGCDEEIEPYSGRILSREDRPRLVTVSRKRRHCRSLYQQIHQARSQEMTHLSSGIPALDQALGGRGYPSANVALVMGPAMSGKSQLVLKVAREAQKAGLPVLIVDCDGSLSSRPHYGALVAQPDSPEDVLPLVEDFVHRNLQMDGLVVIDGWEFCGSEERLQLLEKLIGDSGLFCLVTQQSRRAPLCDPELLVYYEADGSLPPVILRLELSPEGVRARTLKHFVAPTGTLTEVLELE